MFKKVGWAVIVAAGAFGAALGGSFAAGSIHNLQQSTTTQNCTGGRIGGLHGIPANAGTVTNISGSTITITSLDGTKKSVNVDSSTKYTREGQSASLSDIKVGDEIFVKGTVNSDGSIKAGTVAIQLPRVAGKVTKIDGSTYTIASLRGPFNDGQTAVTTVVVGNATKFSKFDNSAATSADVKVNSTIIAEGTLSADGKTLQADIVNILPDTANGVFGHDLFGGQMMGRSQWFGGVNQGDLPGTLPANPAFGAGPGA
jgi:Domain of unknown function (DUF5666)